MKCVYLNGEFVAPSEGRIGVFDGAWLHGAGLFETMRAQYGKIFRLSAHLSRIRRSAERLLQPLEEEIVPSNAVFEELLARSDLRDARVRLTVSSGSMLEAVSTETRKLTLCITAAPLTGYPPQAYTDGIQVAVCPFQVSPTDPIARHKTTAYLPRLLGLREAQSARCIESLWFNTRRQLAEGSVSNVFVIKNGVLQTPPLDTPVLPGITRAAILELATSLNIERAECELTINDLLDADEIFLTNSIMQVMPVVRVERSDIADAKVGPITLRLTQAYQNLVREECGG